jgi:hypothetical protein
MRLHLVALRHPATRPAPPIHYQVLPLWHQQLAQQRPRPPYQKPPSVCPPGPDEGAAGGRWRWAFVALLLRLAIAHILLSLLLSYQHTLASRRRASRSVLVRQCDKPEGIARCHDYVGISLDPLRAPKRRESRGAVREEREGEKRGRETRECEKRERGRENMSEGNTSRSQLAVRSSLQLQSLPSCQLPIANKQ